MLSKKSVIIPKFIWHDDEKQSEDTRKREWAYAKKHLMRHGTLLPSGTKLRREDHKEDITHSFLVLDGRIFAMSQKGVYLGEGDDGVGKLAVDEEGRLIVLKVTTCKDEDEIAIAKDLYVGGGTVSRKSALQGHPRTKHYHSLQYFGIGLSDFLEQNPDLSLDERYELSIKITLALHDLHTGKKSASKTCYRHGDVHIGNITVDEQGEVHFIDFGETRQIENGTGEQTIFDTRCLIDRVLHDRYHRGEDVVRARGIFTKFGFGLASRSGSSIVKKNQVLRDLLTNYHTEFSKKYFNGMKPSALDIAELLTLCRFHLEPYHKLFYERSPAKREKTIRMLNAANEQILGLHEKLQPLGITEDLIKAYFVYKLLGIEIDQEADIYVNLAPPQLKELRSSIKQLITQLKLPDLKEKHAYPFERVDAEKSSKKKRVAHKTRKRNKKDKRLSKKKGQTELSHDTSKAKVDPPQSNIKKEEIVITSNAKASAATNDIYPVLSTMLSNAKEVARKQLPTYYAGIGFFRSFKRTFKSEFVRGMQDNINQKADNVFELLYWLDTYIQEVNQEKGRWRIRGGDVYYSALRKRLEAIKDNVVEALKKESLGDILEIYHQRQCDFGKYKCERQNTGLYIYKLRNLPTRETDMEKSYRRSQMQDEIKQLKSAFSKCAASLHQKDRMGLSSPVQQVRSATHRK